MIIRILFVMILAVALGANSYSQQLSQLCVFNTSDTEVDYAFGIDWDKVESSITDAELKQIRDDEYIYTVVAAHHNQPEHVWPQLLGMDIKHKQELGTVVFTVGNQSSYPLRFELVAMPPKDWKAFIAECKRFGGGPNCRITPDFGYIVASYPGANYYANGNGVPVTLEDTAGSGLSCPF